MHLMPFILDVMVKIVNILHYVKAHCVNQF